VAGRAEGGGGCERWPRCVHHHASRWHAQLAARPTHGRDQRHLEGLGAVLVPATPPPQRRLAAAAACPAAAAASLSVHRPESHLAVATPLQRQEGVHWAHLRLLRARQALAHRCAAIIGERSLRQWSAQQLGLRRGPSPPPRRGVLVLTQTQPACRLGGRLRASAPVEQSSRC